MSVSDERSALDRPVSLFDHAQRLHRRTPDDPLPDGGRPFPDDDAQPRTQVRAQRSLLRELLADPSLPAQELHNRCLRLPISIVATLIVGEVVSTPSEQLLETARWLVRHGTDRRPVAIGIGLLIGRAEPRDVTLLKTIGRLRFVDRPAVLALARIPGAGRDAIWLAERSRPHARLEAVEWLVGDQDPAVKAWVRATPRHLLSSDLARKIAETHGLVDLSTDDAQWDQVGNLLLAMTSPRNYQAQVGRYADAAETYRRWVTVAERRTPSLDGAAMLAMVAEDLRTGFAAPVLGDDHERLIDRIGGVLSAPPWLEFLHRSAESDDPVEARRAAWAIAESAKGGVPTGRFAVRVVVPDPTPTSFSQIETRILIDGAPVIAQHFDKGAAEDPEYLVHGGRLRALDHVKKVRLAEAYCTEGCCGALYATITREGSEAVWQLEGHEFRFDAAEYDREIARAERDHGWEWPARTAARLIGERLRTEPQVLTQWDCRLNWCTAWLRDFDTVRLTFEHPAARASFDDPSVQFGLVIDVDGDPTTVAADVVESLRTVDPKSTAEIVGGSKDGAEKLGLTDRASKRW
ncbi:hypothetical protein [Kutzneria buriramensis]|uniref:Uncharacterized protein n=1 Tax=Kutzneria buriramensis TaxID=1045776 RepID=A0A3E0HUA2_9PSEU|nr:hypothetical protein [Kutzneria buriramensis]REH49826.1 hypothetical protein BCF44_10489 [Kutzneria buriramensis]